MIEISYIRENPNQFEKLMAQRNSIVSAKTILNLDNKKRKIISEIQELQTDRNEIYVFNFPHISNSIQIKIQTNI